MTLQEEEIRDDAIPALAVKALSDATKRALQAGRTIVFVKNHRLIRKGPDGDIVLKDVPGRLKVKVNGKSANS
jgi:hypothetical protein